MSPLNPDIDTSTIEDKELSKEDAIEFLATEDSEESEIIELDKSPKKTEKTPEKEYKEDKEEGLEEKEKSIEEELEEELNEELETPDEEELELISPVRRKEILAKYPDIFKDFPYLQKAYYFDRQITEILPTIEDAKAAVEKAEILDGFETDIMGGSTKSLLAQVKENDKEAFAKVVDNYLPNLYEVDQDAYFHTIGNITKHTIISMVRDGKENDVKELIEAADVLNQYMFGTKQFAHPTRLSKVSLPDESKKEEELAEREQEFVRREFETAKDGVITKLDNILKSTIDQHIDPKKSMTDYVRKNATREVSEKLENLIENDRRFMAIYDKLWERAMENNFSKESMDKVKSAYLSKARTLLPTLIKNARNEALRGLGKRVNDDNDEKDKKGPLPVGKARSSASSQNSGKSGDAPKRGETSLEFLMRD